VSRRVRLPAEPSAGQEGVLTAVRELAAAGGKVSAVAVAAKLGITRQAATRQLLLLERKGFVCDVRRKVRSGNWAIVD
jgi:predicted ArsR family transcriptional regulator